MSETPNVADVFRAISALNGHSTALALCEHLVREGYSRDSAQLAIQRACDSGGILGVDRDLTLSLKAPAQEVDRQRNLTRLNGRRSTRTPRATLQSR